VREAKNASPVVAAKKRATRRKGLPSVDQNGPPSQKAPTSVDQNGIGIPGN